MMRASIAAALAIGCSAPSDPPGVPLSEQPMIIDGIAIAGLDDGYAIMWLGRAGAVATSELWFARVTPDGVLRAPARSLLALTAGLTLRVSPHGDNLVAVWLDGDIQNDGSVLTNSMRAATVTRDGVLVRGPVLVSSEAYPWRRNFTVATGASIGVGFIGASALPKFLALDTDLTPLSPTVQLLPNTGGNVCTIASANDFMIVMDDRDAITESVYSMSGAQLAAPAPFAMGRYPACSHDGDAMLAWNDSVSDQIRIATRDATWAMFGLDVPPNRRESRNIVVGRRADRAIVVWEGDFESQHAQVYEASLDLASPVAAPVRLTDVRFEHHATALATRESEAGLVYVSDMPGGHVPIFHALPW